MIQRKLRLDAKLLARTMIPRISFHTSCSNGMIDHLSQQSLSIPLASSPLDGCSNSSLLRQGRQTHGHLITSGIGTHIQSGAKILGMYVLCGSFRSAAKVFYNLDLHCTMPWNLMIRNFVQMGWLSFALLFYFKMLGNGVCPDKYTFPCIVKACSGLDNMKLVKFVHAMIFSLGLDDDLFVASSLIKVYAENGCIQDARTLFDKIPQRDSVLWNVMLNGYVKCGESDNAIEAFLEMRNSQTKPNSVTFTCLLSVCASETKVDLGSQLHGLGVKFGLEFESRVANTLLAMYSKSFQLSDARKLFDMMPQKDLVSWNSMIDGYVHKGFMQEASCLLREMISARVSPDAVTFSSFLPSVAESAMLEHCKEIHGYIVRHGVPLDLFLKSSLLDTYFKCRDVKMAQVVFDQCNQFDVVVCTTMISGYVLNFMNLEALESFKWLFKEKMTPNAVTLSSLLPACAGLVALKLGKELHAYILRRGLSEKCYVESALMDMYAKCGKLGLAHQIFEMISEKDNVCWNSMITSCSQNGRLEESIDFFREMGISGAKYDCVSISAALSACANLPAQHYGKEIHGFMIKGSFCSDVLAESALIDMYAKCGSLDSARYVFEQMQDKNDVSWNSIIAAYASHGCLKECLCLFRKMIENNIQPDHITFLAAISVCGHVGDVDEGVRFFNSMTKEYGIPAKTEHYACMVDLFGRAGRLNEAFETIKSMPFSADAGVWGTLLGACRVHGNVELAKVASTNLLALDPQNSGYYVLLSNTLANAGEWGNVVKIRSLMKEKGVQKLPGYSWIEVNTSTHLFVAADVSHRQSAQIYSLLKLLVQELNREGYAPQPYLQLHPQVSS